MTINRTLGPQRPSRRLLPLLSASLLSVLLASAGCATASNGQDQGLRADEVSSSTEGAASPTVAGVTAADTPASTTDTNTVDGAGGETAPRASRSRPVLLEAGAEPRVELRLTPEVGQVDTLVVEQSARIVQTVDGVERPIHELALSTTADVTVENVNDGLISGTVLVRNVGSSHTDPGFHDTLQNFVGVTEAVTVSDKGELVGSGLGNYETVRSDVRSLVTGIFKEAELGAPLPDEPVGIGATWSVDQVVNILGIDVTQTATYTLVSMEGSTIELQVDVSQQVPAGTKGGVEGVEVEVLLWEAAGTGSLVWDLTKLVTTSDSNVSIRQNLRYSDGETLEVDDQTNDMETRTMLG